jgi:hypothetical protein
MHQTVSVAMTSTPPASAVGPGISPIKSATHSGLRIGSIMQIKERASAGQARAE